MHVAKTGEKKEEKKTTRPSKRGTSSAVARSEAIERFLRVRTRIVGEYSPRAIISASPRAQRLGSKLVESIRRTNRGFDALRRFVDATTDSASELSTFENGIGMQTGRNYRALKVRYVAIIPGQRETNDN